MCFTAYSSNRLAKEEKTSLQGAIARLFSGTKSYLFMLDGETLEIFIGTPFTFSKKKKPHGIKKENSTCWRLRSYKNLKNRFFLKKKQQIISSDWGANFLRF